MAAGGARISREEESHHSVHRYDSLRKERTLTRRVRQWIIIICKSAGASFGVCIRM